MPLSCQDKNTNSIITSLTVPPDEWEDLRATNRHRNHLQMRCCPSSVVLKTSKLGTRFFAHKTRADCASEGETYAHLKLKEDAFHAAVANGWAAQTEYAGVSDTGSWIADVYATKKNFKYAIEIQWSRQADDETLRRQRRYKDSDVQGLWIFRQKQILGDSEIPAFRVEQSEDSFLIHAYMNLDDAPTLLPSDKFFDYVFKGCCRATVPIGIRLPATIWLADTTCWRCKRTTTMVFGVAIGSNGADLDSGVLLHVRSFAENPTLLASVLAKLPAKNPIGRVKPRYSKTLAMSYLSNGCRHCDALIGQHFEYRVAYDAYPAQNFHVIIDYAGAKLLRSADAEFRGAGWRIYPSLIDSPADDTGATKPPAMIQPRRIRRRD